MTKTYSSASKKSIENGPTTTSTASQSATNTNTTTNTKSSSSKTKKQGNKITISVGQTKYSNNSSATSYQPTSPSRPDVKKTTNIQFVRPENLTSNVEKINKNTTDYKRSNDSSSSSSTNKQQQQKQETTTNPQPVSYLRGLQNLSEFYFEIMFGENSRFFQIVSAATMNTTSDRMLPIPQAAYFHYFQVPSQAHHSIQVPHLALSHQFPNSQQPLLQ